MIAIGYTRVSTQAQADEGVSLDAQRARIEAWASSHGYELRAMETDAGLSGGRADNRPALQRALDAACKARGVLVVYSLSRLARSTKDALLIMERLKKHGANLVSLSESIDTTTAMGTFVFTLFAALAKLERDLVSERTRMAVEHKQSRGEYIGGVAPYGFRVTGGSLVPDDDEQRVLAIIRYQHGAGNGPAVIARNLNAALTPCRGSAWHAKTVSRVIAREVRA